MPIVKFLIIFSIINNNLISAENHYRIIGGNPAPIEKHPWMVSIQFLNVHFCGGSIINENSIITAAHCFDETPFALTIEAGTADLTQSGVSINVDQILVHENYNPETYDFDIAILKLTEPLNFNEKIKPILLPDETIEISDETPVVTSGWGVTEEDGIATSNILLEVEIYTRNWEECKETLKNDNQITERMLCAGYSKGGRDTCQADSGGALEMNGSLIGIVSWGHGCGEAEYPGVYTKVPYFISWIKEHIEL